MKTYPNHPSRQRSTPDLLATLLLSLILLGLILLATSCGGTFVLRPDGSLSYTTPEILKAPIVEGAK